MKKLTVSSVGGGTGGRLSLAAVAASEYFEPVALADLRPEVGTELGRNYSKLRTFTDFREMFRTCPTDVVCVSTYPPSHEAVALEALKLPEQKGVPWAVSPPVLVELTSRDMPVLAETPPAPDLGGLIQLWKDLPESARVQVATFSYLSDLCVSSEKFLDALTMSDT